MIELLAISIVNTIVLLTLLYVVSKLLPKNEKYPLALPKGTVRALLTLLIILPVPIVILKGIETPKGFWYIVGIVLTYYFGSRFLDRKNEQE